MRQKKPEVCPARVWRNPEAELWLEQAKLDRKQSKELKTELAITSCRVDLQLHRREQRRKARKMLARLRKVRTEPRISWLSQQELEAWARLDRQVERIAMLGMRYGNKPCKIRSLPSLGTPEVVQLPTGGWMPYGEWIRQSEAMARAEYEMLPEWLKKFMRDVQTKPDSTNDG